MASQSKWSCPACGRPTSGRLVQSAGIVVNEADYLDRMRAHQKELEEGASATLDIGRTVVFLPRRPFEEQKYAVGHHCGDCALVIVSQEDAVPQERVPILARTLPLPIGKGQRSAELELQRHTPRLPPGLRCPKCSGGTTTRLVQTPGISVVEVEYLEKMAALLPRAQAGEEVRVKHEMRPTWIVWYQPIHQQKYAYCQLCERCTLLVVAKGDAIPNDIIPEMAKG